MKDIGGRMKGVRRKNERGRWKNERGSWKNERGRWENERGRLESPFQVSRPPFLILIMINKDSRKWKTIWDLYFDLTQVNVSVHVSHKLKIYQRWNKNMKYKERSKKHETFRTYLKTHKLNIIEVVRTESNNEARLVQ